MSDISFSTACKELKIAQIAQSARSTFAFSSYIRPRLLLCKSYAIEQKCNNDVSKDSPITVTVKYLSLSKCTNEAPTSYDKNDDNRDNNNKNNICNIIM